MTELLPVVASEQYAEKQNVTQYIAPRCIAEHDQ